jgi:polyferredoxin/tetratricopeptide (TPR) repeat protein
MRCDQPHLTDSGGRTVSLAVLPADREPDGRSNRPKPHSRVGRYRAIVLTAIQLVLIAHVAQWFFFGTTLSPFEPSDSMATFKEGVINAGTVVFGIGLISTLVLGRWFCGWGCHIIFLQDACAWLLERVGIRPKPFRSRLLLFVPLGLAVYMFLWPVFYRLAIAPYTRPELSWPGFTTRFIIEDYWASFPGVILSIPFLLVCGFLIVYLLGTKGYCTYACPYGGFFAPLDEFAVGRIRVNDRCEGCGHCTAVCTSNVRVHEEVRDFGMVVDPGCMKCMDCVSVCPNDALSFGFGAPAVLAKSAPEAKPKPRGWDLSWRQEWIFAVLALVAFLATRGTFGFTLPLLFSSGVTACIVFLAFKAWQVMSRPNVRLHRWQLKLRGRLRPAGAVWLVCTGLLLLVTLHSAAINALGFVAAHFDDRVTTPPGVVFSQNPVQSEAPILASAERALSLYQTISTVGRGGYGIFPPIQPAIEQRKAWLLSVLGRYDEAETTLRDAIERDGLNEPYAMALARVERAIEPAKAIAHYESTLREHPLWVQLQDEYVQWLESEGSDADAIIAARRGLERARAAGANAELDLFLMRRLSIILSEKGVGQEIQEGVDLVLRTLEIAPDNPFAYRALAIGYARMERMEEAEAALRTAIRLAPRDWRLVQSLGELLMGIGKEAEGAELIKEATRIRGRS